MSNGHGDRSAECRKSRGERRRSRGEGQIQRIQEIEQVIKIHQENRSVEVRSPANCEKTA